MFEETDHTLAQFIDASMQQEMYIKNLPPNLLAADAAEMLRRPDIMLKGLGVNKRYFSGLFDHPVSRKGETTEGKILFTFAPANRGPGHTAFNLTLTEEGLTLLNRP